MDHGLSTPEFALEDKTWLLPSAQSDKRLIQLATSEAELTESISGYSIRLSG